MDACQSGHDFKSQKIRVKLTPQVLEQLLRQGQILGLGDLPQSVPARDVLKEIPVGPSVII